MRVKMISDVHLEFSDITINNHENVDVLVLGGDIMVADDLYNHPEPATPFSPDDIKKLGKRQAAAHRFRDFLKRCSVQFPHVIYIAGNHEFYHGKWFQTLDILRSECDKFDNVYFLECDSKKIDNVTFIGGTLWTDMNRRDTLTLNAVRDMLNDFKVIRVETQDYRKLRPEDTVVRHDAMLKYIKEAVADHPDEKFVVVGHHAPSQLSTHENYKSNYLMNGAYSSDLSEFILDHPQIKLWTMGHTHHAHWYYIGDTLITCNPRGYNSDGYNEHTGWNENFIINLDTMPDKDHVSKNYDNLF